MYRQLLRIGFGVVFLLVLAPAASAQTPAPTCRMDINPTVVERGSQARLFWQSTNTASTTIVPLGDVATTGSRTVRPSRSTTYFGTFVGPGGITTCQIGVAVYSRPGAPYSPGTPGVTGGTVTGGGGTVTGSGGNTVQSQPLLPSGSSGGRLGTGQSNVVPFSSGTPSPGGLQSCSGLNCTLCDLGQLVQNVINFLIGLSIPIAIFMFAWAGILYFTSTGSEERVKKAKKIFRQVFIGFVIALTGWLVIQTVLSVLVKQSFYIGGNWNNLDCGSASRPGVDYTVSVGDFLGTLAPFQSAPITVETDLCSQYGGTFGNGACVYTTGTDLPIGSTFCPPGYVFTSSLTCADATGAALPQNVSFRVPGSYSSCNDFGLTPQQSCIASYESSCNPSIGSGVDVGVDNNAVSWGLFQINLSAHSVQCGAQTLNCPSAFGGGTYTANNHGTYVTNQALFEQCKQAVQNVQCNAQMMQQIYANQGIGAWGTKAQNNCSGL